MENNTNKVVSVSFMVVGILVGFVVSVMIDTLAAIATGATGRFFAQETVRHGLPVLVGLGLFLLLQFNKKIHSWADEVVTEISRVVWPSRKETVAMTIMVCVMVIISGLCLGVLDIFSGSMIDWLLHRDFSGLF
jgi:preprotein translocase subunit SecE